MREPLVSVIIPSFNADDGLKDAIESVLNQEYTNFEIIVVDDNNSGTEARRFTEKIMQCYHSFDNVIYIRHEKNKNGAAARNTGISVAKGKYIAFLDDDDVYYPERLSECVHALESNPEYSAVYSNVDIYICGKHNRVIEAQYSGKIWKELLLNEWLLGSGSNLFLNREVVDSLGGFDETFIRYQDVEFMLRVLEKYSILALSKSLIKKNCSNRNIPEYQAFRNNRLKVFHKFSYLINQLNECERYQFYEHQYKNLFSYAINGNNGKLIRQAAKELGKVRKLTPKEKVLAYCPYLVNARRTVLKKVRGKLNG